MSIQTDVQNLEDAKNAAATTVSAPIYLSYVKLSQLNDKYVALLTANPDKLQPRLGWHLVEGKIDDANILSPATYLKNIRYEDLLNDFEKLGMPMEVYAGWKGFGDMGFDELEAKVGTNDKNAKTAVLNGRAYTFMIQPEKDSDYDQRTDVEWVELINKMPFFDNPVAILPRTSASDLDQLFLSIPLKKNNFDALDIVVDGKMVRSKLQTDEEYKTEQSAKQATAGEKKKNDKKTAEEVEDDKANDKKEETATDDKKTSRPKSTGKEDDKEKKGKKNEVEEVEMKKFMDLTVGNNSPITFDKLGFASVTVDGQKYITDVFDAAKQLLGKGHKLLDVKEIKADTLVKWETARKERDSKGKDKNKDESKGVVEENNDAEVADDESEKPGKAKQNKTSRRKKKKSNR